MSDLLKKYKLIVGVIVGSITISSFIGSVVWGAYVKPQVKKEIECQQKPLEESIKKLVEINEYHTYLFMSMADSTELQWANDRYTAFKGHTSR